MFPCLGFGYGYWWIFPLIMITMMVLCFFMMRGHGGSMMCMGGRRQINKQDYEEKKEDIARRT